MPKLKTNKAIKKRFKVTGKGKVLTLKTKRRHLLGDRSASKKRRFRGWHEIDETKTKMILKGLPYEAR
jgi:large subunit ribosomal protein L35